jgi:uncharacterized membrane protein YqjE
MERPAMEDPASNGDPSVGLQVSRLITEVETLVLQELRLARCELAEKARAAQGGLAKWIFAGVLGLAGILALGASLILCLTPLLSRWMTPLTAAFTLVLILGVVLLAIGWVLYRSGRQDIRPGNLLPEKTVESLKENARWAKHQW